MGNKGSKNKSSESEGYYYGMDIEHRNFIGETLLMRAIRYHRAPEKLKRVKELIALGANLDVQDTRGVTALMSAFAKLNVSDGDSDKNIIKLLIESGADVCIKDERRESALMKATLTGRITADILEAILDAGGDANEIDINGNSVLMKAIYNFGINVCDGSYDIRGYDEFYDVRHYNNVHRYEVIKTLIERGVDLNVRNLDGDWSLTLAIKRLHCPRGYDIIQMLLDAGVDTDVGCIELTDIWGKEYSELPRRLSRMLPKCKLRPAPKVHKHCKVRKKVPKAIRISDTCTLCLDSSPELVYKPCRHAVNCTACFNELVEKECPVCSVTVISAKPVHLSETCVVCLDSSPELMYVPCHHAVTCTGCYESLDDKECPVCCAEISSIRFLSPS